MWRKVTLPIVLAALVATMGCAQELEQLALCRVTMAVSFAQGSDGAAVRVYGELKFRVSDASAFGDLPTIESQSSVVGGVTFVDFFLPSGATPVSGECTVFDAAGLEVGYGEVLDTSLGGGFETVMNCVIESNAQAGSPTQGTAVRGRHVINDVMVMPEPVDCRGDTIEIEVEVSEPVSKPFNFYATGTADRITLPGAQTADLSDRVAVLAGQPAAPSGTRYTLRVEVDDYAGSDRVTNIWVIDPDSDNGQVLRSTTLCGTGIGEHWLTVVPVLYFYTDGSLILDITESADGTDLIWSCDTDLDGRVDQFGAIPDHRLLGIQARGNNEFELLVTPVGVEYPTPSLQVIGCTH